MSLNIGNNYRNQVLDSLLGSGTPATLIAKLYTAAPSAGGGGTEMSGSGYTAPSVTNNSTNFPAASGGTKSNGTAISFGTATADWANPIVAWALVNSADGTIVYWDNFATPRSVFNGDGPSFGVGQMSIATN